MTDPVNILPLGEYIRQRAGELRPAGPWLEFWEITTPDPGTVLRYVDFSDPDNRSGALRKILFDGEEWDSVPIIRGDIEHREEVAQMPVTAPDPLHQAAFYLRQFDWLYGQKVRWRLTAYENLQNPADAYEETFSIVRASIGEGPPTVTLWIGPWVEFEDRSPHLFFSRTMCASNYPRRGVPGNWCSYPSRNWTQKTREDLRAGATYTVKARRYGWSTQMAQKASSFDSGIAIDGNLHVRSSDPVIAWSEGNRFGPNIFRVLDGDWDVATTVAISPGSRLGWYLGIVAQDETIATPVLEPGEPPPPIPASSWVMWALADDGAGGAHLLRRRTISDVSDDASYALNHPELRVERVGDTFNVYSRADAVSAWTLREAVSLTLPAQARVGLVVGADGTSPDELIAYFGPILFASGGLATCSLQRKGLAGCEAHGNIHEFNAWEEMPDA